MSWEDQGRQAHGWFGHGTSPAGPGPGSDGRGFGREAMADRMRAVAHGALGALPASLRMGAGAQLDAGTLSRLEVVLAAWGLGEGLTPGKFAGRFLGRAADDPIVAVLQRAGADAGTGARDAGQGHEMGAPAQTVQGVGPDRRAPAAAEAQAAAEKAKSDADQRLALARNLVRTGGHGTAEDAEVVAQHLAAKMSLAELQRLQKLGIHVTVVHDSVTDYLTRYRGVQPRGYTNGNTWDTISGTVDPASGFRNVVIATHEDANGARALPGIGQTSSADALLHEIGHAINYREGSLFSLASGSTLFKKAYDQDAGTGPLALPYYHQTDTAAGRDEAFAESHAQYVSDPNAMKVQYPNLYAYWQQYLGDDR